MLDYSNLEKNKLYCYQCFKNGILNPIDNGILFINCNHMKTNFYKLQWCEDCNKWVATRGKMISNDKSCCLKRLGLGRFSKKAKQAEIESKKRNGTLLNGIKSMQKSYIGSRKHKENAKRAIIEYNKTDKHKEIAKKIIYNWNNSDIGKETCKSNGLNYGKRNLEKWVGSEQHINQVKSLVINNQGPGNCTSCNNFVEFRDVCGRCENCTSIYKRDNNGRIISIGSLAWSEYINNFRQQKSLNFNNL